LGGRRGFCDGAGLGLLGDDVEVCWDVCGDWSSARNVADELSWFAWVAVQVVEGGDCLLEVVRGM